MVGFVSVPPYRTVLAPLYTFLYASGVSKLLFWFNILLSLSFKKKSMVEIDTSMEFCLYFRAQCIIRPEMKE